MATTETRRQTADERREAVLSAATQEFADRGFHGASTEAIARAAGISQPYLFRLFGTKKSLYVATARTGMRVVIERMAAAAEGETGPAALHAMGEAYEELIRSDPMRLKLMQQCFASCDDDDVRAEVREVWRELVALAERSGEDVEAVSAFFAKGMLLNVMMAMRLFDDPTPWGDRLAEGCLTR
jgi:AcrR family transcriptional regulator